MSPERALHSARRYDHPVASFQDKGSRIRGSGNVWLANNWENVPLQTNLGGHALVVFIGLAAPVKAPLIGPPEEP
jgi:hypothetical protein